MMCRRLIIIQYIVTVQHPQAFLNLDGRFPGGSGETHFAGDRPVFSTPYVAHALYRVFYVRYDTRVRTDHPHDRIYHSITSRPNVMKVSGPLGPS